MEEILTIKVEAIKASERTERDKATLKRLLIIRLILEGYTIPQVMKIANCSEKTVYNCQTKYEASGIPGLSTKPKSGRNKKLTDEQEQVLYETIKTKLPSEVGFAPFANWTSSLAVQWIKANFNIEFSDRGLRNLFKRIGLSYTRPTYTLKKADPEKQADFVKEFEQIKKN
jgi:putative transposase